MSNTKTEILQQFDELIDELEVLLDEMSVFPSSSAGWDLGVSSGDVPQDYVKKYYQIRTRCLVVLNNIDSKDASLQSAIDHLRDIEFHEFNIKNVLKNMQALRSDFAADALTKYPRLPDTLPPPPVEKQNRFDPSTTQIIVAIISVIGSILVAVISFFLGLNAGANNQSVATQMPSPTVTIIATSTQSPTEEITISP